MVYSPFFFIFGEAKPGKMKSRYSLSLGKPFGIKVSVHWTFSLLIAWIVLISVGRGLEFQQILMHIIFVLALFVCVVLHELGHSLAAIRLGGQVDSITLLPIGGMAHLSKMPEKPKDEFLVSAAGPLVNVVIAAILWIYIAFVQPVDFDKMEFEAITVNNFPVMLLAANLFIVAFNLIPAFPMDGGRLFRSLLSIRMSRLKATRIAKDIGQIFAILFIITGLFFNPFLVIIGFFILLGAKGEYEMIKYQDILQDYTVNDIVKTEYAELDEEDTLGYAAERLVKISDNGFVIKSGGVFKGILTKNDLINGLNSHGKDIKIKDIVRTETDHVDKDTGLFQIYQDMQRKRKYLLAVFDQDEFKGVLDLENLHEFFLIRKATR
ncbi:MAG: site-2 protease family protein [Bacteroidia bacterium]|nr:MAG: site-2 protease family protein [Bacteroidia bacterium]